MATKAKTPVCPPAPRSLVTMTEDHFYELREAVGVICAEEITIQSTQMRRDELAGRGDWVRWRKWAIARLRKIDTPGGLYDYYLMACGDIPAIDGFNETLNGMIEFVRKRRRKEKTSKAKK
jgi:hypothetical protein